MILIHRPDGSPLHIAVSHIVTVEATPDTVITLWSGDKLRAHESAHHVCEQIDAWFHRVGALTMLPLPHTNLGHTPNDDKDP